MWAEGTVDGKYVRRSLKTKSWEKATRINKEIDESQNPDPKPKDEPVSVVQAVEEYLADAKARELGEATLYKLEIIFRKQLLTWAKAEGYRPTAGVGPSRCAGFQSVVERWRSFQKEEAGEADRLLLVLHSFRLDHAEPHRSTRPNQRDASSNRLFHA